MVPQHLYRGHGLALLDPHGDLAEELLDHFPTARADDLVYFNPGDLAEVRQAVLGNVGTIISFRVGHTDADVVRDEFGKEFATEQLTDLNPHHILVSPMENGMSRAPFRAASLPRLASDSGDKVGLPSRSRERFSASRNVIEAKIRRWCAVATERASIP